MLTIQKNKYGAWEVDDIIDGYLVTRTYYFYTKREAQRKFREEFPKRKDQGNE